MENTRDDKLYRDLCAYWLLGLCNNYGYVVMLSAAHDIIGKFNAQPKSSDLKRECHILSTGIILLADIIPSLVMKLIAPFVPYWMNLRIFFAVATAAAGFIFVGIATNQMTAIFGVVLTAASSGLGESTFIAYSVNYNKNVISTWSSGTGAAGIGGSVTYAALKSLNVSHTTSMFLMLVVPAIEAIAFWIILRHHDEQIVQNDNDNKTNDDDEQQLILCTDKLIYIIYLLKYMIPLILVFIAEYFINQGLFELIYFENIFLDHASQYRWFSVDYQIGVFISRSSVNLYSINNIWILSILQFVNVAYFLIESIYYVTPSIWIVFSLIFWEGLLGGGAYVNTFYRMSKEILPARKRFAMSIVSLSDTVGIALAGFASLPAHNAICKLVAPVR